MYILFQRTSLTWLIYLFPIKSCSLPNNPNGAGMRQHKKQLQESKDRLIRLINVAAKNHGLAEDALA